MYGWEVGRKRREVVGEAAGAFGGVALGCGGEEVR